METDTQSEKQTEREASDLIQVSSLSVLESQERANIGRPKGVKDKSRRKRHSSRLFGITEKHCPRCKIVKEISEFRFNSYDEKYSSWCTPCVSNRLKEIYKSNPDRFLKRNRKARYGLSHETEVRLLVKQNNVCAACRRAFGNHVKLCRDHCHDLNHFRGFLCQECNFIEGWARKTGYPIEALTNMLQRFKDSSLFTGIK